MKLLFPIILIGVAIAVFAMVANPLWSEISALREEAVSYNDALSNSKALENERDKLTKKFNEISPENLEKLSKFLPDNVDNIRLILEIEKIAAPYGMSLRDIKYSAEEEKANTADGSPIVAEDPTSEESLGNYGSWNLEFSTEGSYDNFVNFLKSLENNLRLVDVVSVEFSSVSGGSTGGSGSSAQSQSAQSIYKYTFKIQTYWLKN